MRKNSFDIIKKQIDKQTKKSVNTELDFTAVSNVDSAKENTNIISSTTLNPIWTKGSYILNRSTGITVESFRNYSGQIKWELINSKIIDTKFSDKYANNLFGIQLYTRNSTAVIPIEINLVGGYLKVFLKTEDDTSFFEVYDSVTDTDNGIINLELPGNKWATVIFTFVSNKVGSELYFNADFSNVYSWKYLDIISPTVPEWATIPISRTVIDPKIAKVKYTLNWSKDIDIGFGGNGIYKKYLKDSGCYISKSVPYKTVEPTSATSAKEADKWLISFNTGTINSGDVISFSDNSYTISNTTAVLPNLLINGNFRNNNNFWDFSVGTIVSKNNSCFGSNYYELNINATNTKYTLTTGTYTAVSAIANSYLAGIYTSHDLMLDRIYGLDGYNSEPSRWNTTLNSIVATRSGNSEVMTVDRSTGAGTITSGQNSFYLSTTASYSLIAPASSQRLDSFVVSFHMNSGATVSILPTCNSKLKYYFNKHTFTPSVTGSGYLKLTIPATTSSTNFVTLQFLNFKLKQKFNNTCDFNEYFSVNFYQSNLSNCATASATLSMNQGYGINSYSFALGSFQPMKFPVTCSFIKLQYVASLNTISTPINLNRKIFFNYFTKEFINTRYSIFATTSLWVKTTSIMEYTIGSQIKLLKYDHIIDRPRQADDGSIVTWDDFDIEPDTDYSYVLDAYDTSAFKNRSSYSSIATLYSGDTISPKVPTNYILTGLAGGLLHSWTNPTANDLSKIKCYSDVELSNIIFEISSGGTNQSNTYSEFTTSTALASRYLVAIDSFNNESSNTLATASALPQGEVNPFNFSIVWKTEAGVITNPNENGWFNTNIVGSLISDNFGIISTLYYASQGESLTASPTYCHTFTTDINTILYWKAIDIYGHISEYTHEFKLDKTIPAWSLSKYRFWSTTTDAKPGYNLLDWTNSYITDAMSGKDNIYIYRDQVDALNSNPNFEENILSSGVVGWTFNVNSSIYPTLLIETDKKFNGNNCIKLLNRTTAPAASLISSSFKMDTNQSIDIFGRVAGSISGNIIYKLSLRTTNTKSILASISKSLSSYSLSTLYWRFLNFSYYNVSSATFVELCYETTGLDEASKINEYILLDEIVAVKDMSLSFLERVSSGYSSFNDTNVEAWKGYVYGIKVADKAGNISSFSDYKYTRSVMDYRDKYRNLLDNSSFERVYLDSSSDLKAYNWVGYYWNQSNTSPFATTNLGNGGQINTENINAYNSENYIVSSPGYARQVHQHDINVLSYNGKAKRFVYSGYAKKSHNNSSTGVIGVITYNNKHVSVSQSGVSNNYETFSVTSTWERVYGSFNISTPSVKNITFYFGTFSGGSICWDAMQFEEKDIGGPTDYYDTKSLTLDQLQSNLIRGNIIESESIFAENIQANTITATQIKANTITANEIKTNTITTNELNLSDANIYVISEDELRIETTASTSSATIYGDANLALCGVSNLGVIFNIVGNCGATMTYVGTISDTFSNKSFNYYSYAQKVSSNLNGFVGYPLIARSIPYAADGKAFMLLEKDEVFYKTECEYQSSAFCKAEDWSVPTSYFTASGTQISSRTHLAEVGNQDESEFRYYNSNFYLFRRGGALSMDAGYTIFKLGFSYGTIVKSYINSTLNSIIITGLTADISSSGRALLAYSKLSSATLWLNSFDFSKFNNEESQQLLVNEIEIPTYSGDSINIMNGLDRSGMCSVTDVAIAFATINKFILTYRLYNSNYTYYKVISSSGTIYTGKDMDLKFTTNNVNYSSLGTANQNTFRMIRTHWTDSIIYYSPAKRVKDPYGYSIGGKAIHFTFTSPTLNLEDLFNRMA